MLLNALCCGHIQVFSLWTHNLAADMISFLHQPQAFLTTLAHSWFQNGMKTRRYSIFQKSMTVHWKKRGLKQDVSELQYCRGWRTSGTQTSMADQYTSTGLRLRTRGEGEGRAGQGYVRTHQQEGQRGRFALFVLQTRLSHGLRGI